MNSYILSFHIFLPVISAVIILLFGRVSCVKYTEEASKYFAFLIACLNFTLSLIILNSFDHDLLGLQFIEKKSWFSEYNISYHVGVDIISLYFIILTTFLILICVIASWKSIKNRAAEFLAMLLLLEGLVIGVFAAADIVLFYFFFEAVLVPMFLIIGVWGGENRIYASFKFFLYTLFGSVFFLLSILYIVFYSETADIGVLSDKVANYDLETQKLLWLAFFIAFAIKVPMWPFHTWLPDAHVQAPTAGSVMLAGVLLKMGGYGFLRFSIPMMPAASAYYADFIIVLSIIAVIYTSLVALMQKDMKKMIAYSSVAHMGYVTAGLFTFTQQGIDGAIFGMLSHGVISGALFLCIGVLYDRMHTKEIDVYGGLTKRMPSFAFFFMIFMLGSIALPMTSGFIGEFFVLYAALKINALYGLLLALGMVLGAAYMLWLYARLMFGGLKSNVADIKDLTFREKLYMLPLAVCIIWFGINPGVINNCFSTLTNDLVNKVHSVREQIKNEINDNTNNILE